MFKVPEKRAPLQLEVDPKIQKIVDGAPGSDELVVVNRSNLEKHIEWLERAVLLNTDHRLKYALNPEKFMESEVQLDEELSRFQSVATEPELLPLLSSSTKWIQTFLSLLQHPNTDISGRVVALLEEMTELDEGLTPEQYDDIFDFDDALLKSDLLGMLLENIERLDESDADEAEAIYKSMAIIENMVDVNCGDFGDVSEACWTKWKDWLISKFNRPDTPETIQLYTAELAVILLRTTSPFKRAFLNGPEGVDKLLGTVALFHVNGDPKSLDEVEFFENIFDMLCELVMDIEGQDYFLFSQGLELILILLKETKMVRIRALRVLAFALTDRDNAPLVCNMLVEAGALKVLGPIMSRKGVASLKRAYPKFYSDAQDVEYICTIFLCLLRFCQNEALQRVETKLQENDGERIDCLIKLRSELVGDEANRPALGQVDILLALLDSKRLIGLGQLRAFTATKSAVKASLQESLASAADIADEDELAFIKQLVDHL